MNLTQRPKDAPEWFSPKYRRWIRDHRKCFVCGAPLLNEKPDYVSHHVAHTGGEHPRDHMMVDMCLQHHNEHHAGKLSWTLDEWGLLDRAIHCLAEYVESLGTDSQYVRLNALRLIAEKEEKKLTET